MSADGIYGVGPVAAHGVDVSVVIPTYNRARELEGTLRTLAAQDLRTDRYEVIVADDGSHDDTRAVAETDWPMPVRYVRQDDRGFRAGQARNLGAAQAEGDVLVFFDSGMRASHTMLSGHLAVHRAAGNPVVLGYMYGYSNDPAERLRSDELEADVDEIIAWCGAGDRCLDARHDNYRALDGDLGRSTVPWVYCWSGNLSVPAADFRAVGGFDEDFVGWSGEDVELGIRLHRRGLPFVVGREAAAVEIPHERDLDALLPSYREHAILTLRKHPDPWVELSTMFWAHELDDKVWQLQPALRERRLVAGRIPTGRAVTLAPADGRVVVFGADALAAAPGAALCVEPAAELLKAAAGPGAAPGTVLPQFGFRTLRAEREFDTALLAPTLRSYPAWAVELLTAEAERIASRTRWAG
ncbi:glycosyltransferase [Streptomyces sp. NPDC090106]|uniref:glycosyltransferase n=1 Tax=Streptomyces sp. NPDC090106 TaxID=3365946 RepID=UPI0038139EA1